MVQCGPLLKLVFTHEVLAVEFGHTGIIRIIASQETVADHKITFIDILLEAPGRTNRLSADHPDRGCGELGINPVIVVDFAGDISPDST